MLLKASRAVLLPLLAGLCSASPSHENPFENVPPQARVTAHYASYDDLKLRNNEDFAGHVVQPHERQLTLTPGARPTPIYVPQADPKDTYSACFWGIGNAGQSVYKVFETAPTGDQWEAYLLSGPLGVSLYHDQLTTVVNGTLETVIASATCKYQGAIVNNRVQAECGYMAMIDPATTSWYKYTTQISATYTPDLCALNHVPADAKTGWNFGSGNGAFDPNPDSVPESWAVRRFEYWAMTTIWGIGVIGVLAVVGLGVL
ncbi:hypothetical protein CF326_g8369 [Tilletia indica]|nr:hypothetical protein CF326_g8369 [Tilletia indica]